MTRVWKIVLLLIVDLLVVAYALIRNISISLSIPNEAAATAGNAINLIGIVIAAILALLLAVWLMSRIPARAAVAPAQPPAPARRDVRGGESIRRSSLLGAPVRAGLKAILALTIFMSLSFAEEFILSENRRAYPQPDAWWWDHSPPTPLESLASSAAFLVVSFLIVFALNILAAGEDRGARNVVLSVTVFYVVFTLILKLLT